ncbi:MAG: hypothetical protein E7396_03610 [Ruminococcaceae bacterium]|nr:hypothetical protein [Oscillospiraceae bacterium]
MYTEIGGIFLHHLLHIIEHAFLDSVKLLPILFIVYYLIEYFEHKNNNTFNHFMMKSKRTGPLFGGLFGCVPQCGFSVVAANLYAKRTITLGTLIAVFVATSDEAVPILLSYPERIGDILYVLLYKFVIACVSGLCVDLVYKSEIINENLCHNHTHEHGHIHGNCESCDDGPFIATVKHMIRIFLIVFITNIIVGYSIYMIGEETISEFLYTKRFLQPFLSALVGLIPNCAASCVLTELYAEGFLSFGALIGGLSTGAGVGMVVLFKTNKDFKNNLMIVGIVYIIGVLFGSLIQIFC